MSSATDTFGTTPLIRVSTGARTPDGERALRTARNAADSVPIVRTGPTGITAHTPLVAATDGGRTAMFADPTPTTIESLVETLEGGTLPSEHADAIVDHDPDTETLPTPDSGPLSVGRRSVLGPCGWIDPVAADDWTFRSPERSAAPAAEAGLCGRGRGDAVADAPVADAWETARETEGDPVVVVNANDADERTRADGVLLGGAPMAVLDGMAAVARHVGADDAVVYLNEAETELRGRLREAIDAASDSLPVVPQLVVGPDEFRAGSPTAALEALEGSDRIEPRIQPPSPAEHGLYGRPTVVHTPRTFAHVRRAIEAPEGFDPAVPDPGTRLVTVTGDVADPATLELGPNAGLGAVLAAVELRGSFKMACVGGVLGGITRDLDVEPTGRSLGRAGLGPDGVVEVLNDERCVLETVGERARFASTENSGRCVPGREGTKQLTELLRDVYGGSLDAAGIRELAGVMRRSSNCWIGANAPRPVTTALDEFEPEFRAHADGRCPCGACAGQL